MKRALVLAGGGVATVIRAVGPVATSPAEPTVTAWKANGEIRLRDGRNITLRVAAPADVPRIAELYAGLSAEHRSAAVSSPGCPKPALLARLARIDVAPGAVSLIAATPGSDRLAAEARYVPTAEDAGELALAVLDDFQGLGLGRLMLSALIDHAKASGLERLSAVVNIANDTMLHLLTRYGSALTEPADESFVVSLEISATGGMPGWPRIPRASGSWWNDEAGSMTGASPRCGPPGTTCASAPARPRTCPLVEDGRCRLAEDADRIVTLLPGDDADCAAVTEAHRRLWPGKLARGGGEGGKGRDGLGGWRRRGSGGGEEREEGEGGPEPALKRRAIGMEAAGTARIRCPSRVCRSPVAGSDPARTTPGSCRADMFHADLHIHSRFSRACSKDCDIEHLSWWALRKGLTVLGTGDFTHPAWAAELRETLVPAEPGLFRIRPELEDGSSAIPRLPAPAPSGSCSPSRYPRSTGAESAPGRSITLFTRRASMRPDRITTALAKIGNLASDGRPILGLDSRDLLDITLSADPGCFLVPAHVWTPWFAVLGSKSGFDAVQECYADLAGHIFAVETGLSSDPAMNWACSSLDPYRLVSNSDAHSPPMLGREATVFDTDLDYFAMAAALRTGNGLEGHDRVLSRGGEVSPGRAPQMRRPGRPGANPRTGYHLPAVRQAPDRWRPAPDSRACRPPRGLPAARRGRVHQPGPATRDRRRDPGHRAEEQEGGRRGRPAGRRARTRAEHLAGGPARRPPPRRRVAARRGHRPAAARRGHQGRGIRRRIRHDPPVPAG